ncbi:MAG: S-layer homology domain-containing protein, partial [Bacillota bacterium]|nr:S-layer homology domain-containing protein [Bacillota bacterium]
DISLIDTSNSIDAKGIELTSRNGMIEGIRLKQAINPIKAYAKGDIAITVENGNAKVGGIISQQGKVTLKAPKGDISVDRALTELGLIDLKADKLIIDRGTLPPDIKGSEIYLEAQNIGGTARINMEKDSINKTILGALDKIPDVITTTSKTVVQQWPLSSNEIKKEFITALNEKEKSELTKYLLEKIKEVPGGVTITNDDKFAQVLNSIVFFDSNKFYEDVKGFIDVSGFSEEMKNLANKINRTQEEAQRLNRLILEANYPDGILKSQSKEIEITYIDIPYQRDLSIQSGNVNVKSGYENTVTDQDGNTTKQFVPGKVYVYSPSEIAIGSILGSDISIRSEKGIVKADATPAGIIEGNNVFLTVNGAGNIGTEKDPLGVYSEKVSGITQGTIAIGTYDRDNDSSTKENLNVGYLYGLNKVALKSSGAIVDANKDNGFNIESRNPELVAQEKPGKGEYEVKVNKLPMPVIQAPSTQYKQCDNNRLDKLELTTAANETIELSPEFSPDNLNYTASAPNSVQNIIVKLEKDEHAVAEINGNTDLKEGKNTITVKVTAENGNSMTYYIEVTREKSIIKPDPDKPAVVFKDVTGHWAYEAILDLFQKGFVSGYTDKTFKPDKEITRAEVAAILIKAKGINPGTVGKLEFKDSAKVPSWAAGYVKEAVNSGLMVGYPDHTIRANNKITRAEAIVMIMKAFGNTPAAYKLEGFKDSRSIPGWASGYISAAFGKGLIKGYNDNTLKPGNSITRAELTWIVYQCFKAGSIKK